MQNTNTRSHESQIYTGVTKFSTKFPQSFINLILIKLSEKQMKNVIHLDFPETGFFILSTVPQVSISLYNSLNAKFAKRNQTNNLYKLIIFFGGIHNALITKKPHKKFTIITNITTKIPPNLL